MSGQAPKPAEQRRRRNEPMRGEWIFLSPVDPDNPILPELPARADEQDWHPETVEAWGDWRLDPATTQYGPAEIRAAIDLARAHHTWRETGQTSAGAEVRARQSSLGLDAEGKRKLRWVAPTEAEARQEALDKGTRKGSAQGKVVPIRRRPRAVD